MPVRGLCLGTVLAERRADGHCRRETAKMGKMASGGEEGVDEARGITDEAVVVAGVVARGVTEVAGALHGAGSLEVAVLHGRVLEEIAQSWGVLHLVEIVRLEGERLGVFLA